MVMKEENKKYPGELVEGSRYLIKSLHSREKTLETRGEFKGYVFIGRDQGLRVELDDSHEEGGTIRFIPCHMIIHIDVINEVERKEDKVKKSGTYFG